MTNRELFLAISDVVKREAQSVKTGLRSEMQAVRTDLEDEMQAVRTDLGNEIQAVRTDLGSEIDSVNANVNGIEQELARVKADVNGIRQELAEVKTDVRNINLKLENEVNYKIQVLLENYVPAAQKYEADSGRLETLQSDMEMVKKSVKKHSEQLGKLVIA